MKYFLIFGILFLMSCTQNPVRYSPNSAIELHYPVYKSDGKTPYMDCPQEVEVLVIDKHDYLNSFREICHSASCRYYEQNKK